MGFKNIREGGDWDDCPKCNELPHTWVFDNGRYAKCDCIDEYDGKNYISATSVRSCYDNNGERIKEYNIFELRDNWNKHVKHLNRKNKIKSFLDNN